ncbi:uncharacterized protein LOC131949191 [Physella acuta]|uniref:uncharacterized protein LOC131949191 n=1 Tax=Physella acuta TaxID=109671 RepID=UPI0027DDF7F8|nr:uncharacterized protein LOC131949191 [Physella acuta]
MNIKVKICIVVLASFDFRIISDSLPTWSTNSNTYKCNCVTGQCGGHTPCPDGQCSTWWFGPACQYQNLLNDNYTVSVDVADRYKLYDGRDDTCVNVTNSLSVAFDKSYLFTWLRFTVQDGGSNKDSFSLTFKNNTPDWTIPCNKLNTNVVNNRTTDVWCDMNQTTNALKLTWNKPITICSLYVSGGRNLAFRQPTSQSSTYMNESLSGAQNAVDGNIDGVLDHYSCSHTSEAEMNGSPYWRVMFAWENFVNRIVLYNRWSVNAGRLNQFRLEIYNQGERTLNYQDTSTGMESLYTVTMTTVLATSVRITATYNYGGGIFVTLCEVEMFGDSNCDWGKFGLECEKTCNCATDEACFVATGGCPSGCKAGYYGEACQKACEPHTWGISCNQSCNDRCIDNTCNRFNGDCDKGCKDAHQPPACTQELHCFDGRADGIGIGIGVGVVFTTIVIVIITAILHRLKLLIIGRNLGPYQIREETVPTGKQQTEQNRNYEEVAETRNIGGPVQLNVGHNESANVYDAVDFEDIGKQRTQYQEILTK